MFIKKKLFADLEGGTGKISDTINVQDKTTNAPSIRLMEEVIGNNGLEVITDTDISIWNLESGIYRLPVNTTFKYSYNGMVPPTYDELTLQSSTILILRYYQETYSQGFVGTVDHWDWAIYSNDCSYYGKSTKDNRTSLNPKPIGGEYINSLQPYKVLLNTNTTTSATLSDNISNYKRLKIFARSADSYCYSVEAYNNNASDLNTGILVGTISDNTIYYGKSARVLIRGTSLTIDRQSYANITNSGNTLAGQNDAIIIYRVEGYKY